MKTILVIGGAGYIGSHMVRMLTRNGYRPVVLDNLSTGHADAVGEAPLMWGDLGNRSVLEATFSQYPVDAVMHFAACSRVDESMTNPGKYYRNNVLGTQVLLEAMRDHGIRNLVFSSTAAVYDNPANLPIRESQATCPVNPYGRTKLAAEGLLHDFSAAHGLRYTALRYFNAAGADPDGILGERHEPETHLIPIVLQVANGRRASVSIHGTDYPTQDGSCVRDYVHVQDLCAAHLLSLQRLCDGGESAVYNLGNGRGHSVTEVIRSVRRMTGRTVPVIESARRPGDPAILLADSSLAREELGWLPRYPLLDTMIAHAWNWELACHAGTGNRVRDGLGHASQLLGAA